MNNSRFVWTVQRHDPGARGQLADMSQPPGRYLAALTSGWVADGLGSKERATANESRHSFPFYPLCSAVIRSSSPKPVYRASTCMEQAQYSLQSLWEYIHTIFSLFVTVPFSLEYNTSRQINLFSAKIILIHPLSPNLFSFFLVFFTANQHTNNLDCLDSVIPVSRLTCVIL